MKRIYALRFAVFVFLLIVQASAASEQSWARPSHPKFQVLYTFTGGTDGGNPSAGLIRDAAGNLYGTAYAGGDLGCSNGIFSGCGVVFRLDGAGHETVLHRFTGGPADGRNPCAPLIGDRSGNLYGTTCYGGADRRDGTVFKIESSGHETVLYNFTGGADGSTPQSALVRDRAGNLYGTTNYGGSGGCHDNYIRGCGVVFKLDPSGNESVLHSFTGGKDGSHPLSGGVLLDARGNLYGTTTAGGDFGDGVVFKLDRSGKETVLHQFAYSRNGKDGASPVAAFFSAGGTLYGTTSFGGAVKSFGGSVFQVDGAGNESILHSFGRNGDGLSPDGLVNDALGNLYGITAGSAGFECAQSAACGTVFELSVTGKLTVLYTFMGGTGGAYPQVGLIRDESGALYGTTGFSGNRGCLGQGCGTVFRYSS